MTIKNFLYGLSCFLFTLIIGAGVYEHIAIWPHAVAAYLYAGAFKSGEKIH